MNIFFRDLINQYVSNFNLLALLVPGVLNEPIPYLLWSYINGERP